MEMFCFTVYPNLLITTLCKPTKYYCYPPSVTIDHPSPLPPDPTTHPTPFYQTPPTHPLQCGAGMPDISCALPHSHSHSLDNKIKSLCRLNQHLKLISTVMLPWYFPLITVSNYRPSTMEMFCLMVYPNLLIITPCKPTKYYCYPPSVTIDSHRPPHPPNTPYPTTLTTHPTPYYQTPPTHLLQIGAGMGDISWAPPHSLAIR